MSGSFWQWKTCYILHPGVDNDEKSIWSAMKKSDVLKCRIYTAHTSDSNYFTNYTGFMSKYLNIIILILNVFIFSNDRSSIGHNLVGKGYLVIIIRSKEHLLIEFIQWNIFVGSSRSMDFIYSLYKFVNFFFETCCWQEGLWRMIVHGNWMEKSFNK